MANVLGSFNPTFYANEAAFALEKALGLAGRVYRGYDDVNTTRERGDTINIRVPGSFVAQDAPSTAQDINTSSISLVLDQWKEVKIAVTDKELAFTGQQILDEHIRPMTYALANKIDQSLAGLWKYVPWVADFSSPATVADITNVRRIMDENLVPDDDPEGQHFMVSPTIKAELLNLSAFTQHQGAGDIGVSAQMKGFIGQRYGFNFFMNQNTPSVTSATVADVAGAINNALGYAAGSTSIAIDGVTAAGVFQAGDIVQITGHTQQYVLTAAATASSGAVTLAIQGSPFVQGGGLESAVVDDQVVTLILSGGSGTSKVQNIAFGTGAFALGMARLPDFMNGNGVQVRSTPVDVKSKLSVRARAYPIPDTSKFYIALDVLYGLKVLDGNKAVRVRD